MERFFFLLTFSANIIYRIMKLFLLANLLFFCFCEFSFSGIIV